MKILFALFFSIFMGNSFAQNLQEVSLSQFIEEVLKESDLEPVWDNHSYLYYYSFISYLPIDKTNQNSKNLTFEELAEKINSINLKLVKYDIVPLNIKVFNNHKALFSFY